MTSVVQENDLAPVLELARRFTELLDGNHFADARQYLASDCRYILPGMELIGPDAIMSSYEGSYLSAKDLLDDIQFESKVDEVEGGAIVHYLDRIRKGTEWFEHRCQQRLTFTSGKITHIVHIDLPGEQERLNEFFGKHGIRRTLPGSGGNS